MSLADELLADLDEAVDELEEDDVNKVKIIHSLLMCDGKADYAMAGRLMVEVEDQ